MEVVVETKADGDGGLHVENTRVRLILIGLELRGGLLRCNKMYKYER